MDFQEVTIEGNGVDAACSRKEVVCNGLTMMQNIRIQLRDSVIRKNADWGVAAQLKQCGYPENSFTGQLAFAGANVIEGNNTSGNQNGMGNPGSHPWNQSGVPDGRVCLP